MADSEVISMCVCVCSIAILLGYCIHGTRMYNGESRSEHDARCGTPGPLNIGN